MRIEILYPEVCNLYGDLQNIEYLKRSCSDIEVIHTDLHTKPVFLSEKVDMVYMGTTTESSQERVLNALSPYKDELSKAIDDGQFIFLTGNAAEVLGEYIQNEDGSKIECLGLLPTYAVRDMMHRYNSLWIGQFSDEAKNVEKLDIVGFKSQFTHSYFTENSVDNTPSSLFTTERGDGINKGTKAEGIRKNNLFVTYLLGPLFIINPLFTEYILGLLGVEEPKAAYKDAAMDSYKKRVDEFRDMNRGFTY